MVINTIVLAIIKNGAVINTIAMVIKKNGMIINKIGVTINIEVVVINMIVVTINTNGVVINMIKRMINKIEMMIITAAALIDMTEEAINKTALMNPGRKSQAGGPCSPCWLSRNFWAWSKISYRRTGYFSMLSSSSRYSSRIVIEPSWFSTASPSPCFTSSIGQEPVHGDVKDFGEFKQSRIFREPSAFLISLESAPGDVKQAGHFIPGQFQGFAQVAQACANVFAQFFFEFGFKSHR
jgi:hypothetical protein